MYRRQLPSQVSFGHTTLTLPVVSFEEVGYFFGTHGKFFWYEALEEHEVVV
jgi:hypothetical protein